MFKALLLGSAALLVLCSGELFIVMKGGDVPHRIGASSVDSYMLAHCHVIAATPRSSARPQAFSRMRLLLLSRL